MEIAYLMAGKRFKARDVNELNQQLSRYNLISNLSRDGSGDLSARRLTEPQGTSRYDMTQSVGDSADTNRYDVIVGKTIGTNGYNQPDVVEKELSELEIALTEVRIDIPEAKIIAGSYWS